MQRGGPQEFGKGLRLPGESIRDVTEVSHQLLNEVWKCLQTGYLDDLKTSESRLKTSAIVWKRLIQTFQIFGKILMHPQRGDTQLEFGRLPGNLIALKESELLQANTLYLVACSSSVCWIV